MDLNAEYDYSIKLLIIGDSCVGKSNYIIRLIHDQFNKEYLASVGLELKRSEIIINNKKIQLQIWDTAGQVKYKAVTKSLFSKVQGFIAMFDLTKGESFENIKNTIKSIKNECGEHTPIILFEPMVTPFKIVAFAPIQTLSPIIMGLYGFIIFLLLS